jgi:hypothetical protein
MVVGDLLNRERDRGICQLGNGAHIFKIKPAARDVGREVRLVLVIADHDLYRPPEHLSAKVLDRHLRGGNRCLAAKIGIRTSLIVENADAYRYRRLRRGGRLQHERRAKTPGQQNDAHDGLPVAKIFKPDGLRPLTKEFPLFMRRQQQCPLWVISGHFALQLSCPLYPRKRTCAAQLGMSAMGQKRTSVLLHPQIPSGLEVWRRELV